MIQFAGAVMHAWMRRGWLAYLMWPVAQLFGMVLRLRAALYRTGLLRQQKLAVPVIVVGNIFVGGTGKTPFTLWLLSQLQHAGFTPGVISRGYGRKSDAPLVVRANSMADQVGDEPILLAQSGCPVVVGRRRVDAGNTLLAEFPQVNVIISDDGLQHTALARDVEIVLFDARGAGNGWLLPAGPLREPITRRRDITIVNSTEKMPADMPPDAYRMQLKGSRARQLLDASNILELNSMDSGLRIVAAAGIGNPERFFTMLRGHGVRCITLPLPDHYHFADNPFHDLIADVILITEKDAVKCRQLPDIANDARIWVVPVGVDMDASSVENIMANIINKIKRE